MYWKRVPWVLLLCSTLPAVLLAWLGLRLVPESSPVARGASYAHVRACIGCHGDPNNPQMDANDTDCSNVNEMPWHPNYNVVCTDVMAYFEVVRLSRNLGDRARINANNLLITGELLAHKYHCFQCHGQLGQGGFMNSKSLKGYVPGYFGLDFELLTGNADPVSVNEWIKYGTNSTILKKPITGRIAKFFFERQAVHMPSYKSLEPKEIDILTNYVIALNRLGPMTAKMVRSYGEQSRSTN